MKPRKIRENLLWLGGQDWERRLFDSLIPLPDGTSYNAYLIQGASKCVLIDSADPVMAETLMAQLNHVTTLDYVVSHHAEQDHSGLIPKVLEKYPQAKVLCSPKCKKMLIDHLCIEDSKIVTVEDGEEISLGNKTLKFLHTPWVHWPETMCTYVPEEKILFSCDFFGSHLATSDLYVTDQSRVYEAAKRYYAEIMVPFRIQIIKNIEKIEKFPIELIAPSHGPIYPDPRFILDAYKDWISEKTQNRVVLPYISMHGSTKKMVEILVSALMEKGVGVEPFELTGTDIGKLAISLVDASTLVLGSPIVHMLPHPGVIYAAFLANALRPKIKYAGLIGSYGWNSNGFSKIGELIPNLKVEMLGTVFCQGFPRENHIQELHALAVKIAEKHHG